MSESRVSRRKLMQWGLGAAGGLVASRSIAQVCTNSAVTVAQPLGPFFPHEGTPTNPVRENKDQSVPIFLANDHDLTQIAGQPGRAKGQVIEILGKVVDANCKEVAGATVIIWQASSTGRYNHLGDAANADFAHPVTGEIIKREHDPAFQYWGATQSTPAGGFQFKSIIPGFYPADLSGGWYRPPHIHILVSAPGYEQLITQMYFRGSAVKDEAFILELNKADGILNQLSAEQKRQVEVEFIENAADGILRGELTITLGVTPAL